MFYGPVLCFRAAARAARSDAQDPKVRVFVGISRRCFVLPSGEADKQIHGRQGLTSCVHSNHIHFLDLDHVVPS